jgi:hypothetical protein
MNSRPFFFASLACTTFVGFTSVNAAVNFEKEILPVLEAKCLKCHKAPHVENGKEIKPKNDLRLDAAWAILKGGETKEHPALVPKSADKSYIFEVVTLPKDDDMFMPPTGKADPLTPQEIAKLKEWIDSGADFGGWEGNLAGKPADAPAAPAVAKAPPKEREHDKLYKALSQGLQPPSEDALKKAKEAGAQVSILQVGGPLLRVDFLTGVSKCEDGSVAALAPIKENIAHLDLARTNVTDASVKTAAAFPRLTHLDLRKTKITDAGLEALAACKHLNFINLFGTEVTDAGLASLASVKTLRGVYLYETKVTDAGVAKLRKALPEAEIVSNVTMPIRRPRETPRARARRTSSCVFRSLEFVSLSLACRRKRPVACVFSNLRNGRRIWRSLACATTSLVFTLCGRCYRCLSCPRCLRHRTLPRSLRHRPPSRSKRSRHRLRRPRAPPHQPERKAPRHPRWQGPPSRVTTPTRSW